MSSWFSKLHKLSTPKSELHPCSLYHRHEVWQFMISCKNRIQQLFCYNIFKQSAKEDISLWVSKRLGTLHKRRGWKLDRLWTRHDNQLSAANIELSCQLHTPLCIDCMLSTNQSFHTRSNVYNDDYYDDDDNSYVMLIGFLLMNYW